MFNSLRSRGALAGARVVDLFAGSGALGIEALSRGAAHVVFVERDRRALACLRSNLRALGLERRATTMCADVWRALPLLAGERPPDVILADPPYGFDRWAELLERLSGQWLVCETGQAVSGAGDWEIVSHRRHGGTVVTLLAQRGVDRT